MKNKKTIMAFSALLILLFHLWINLTNYQIENYLRELCVIGVDLFFFVSAYSIGKKEILYSKLLQDRFQKIYLKFLLFAILGFFYYHWSLTKFISIILGLELFKKGGGSFLWFLPTIMLVYLILPLYKKIDIKHPILTPVIGISSYLLVSISVSLFTNWNQIFIFFNRIPIILIGYYTAKNDILEYLNQNKIRYLITTISTLITGIILTYLIYINHFYLTWYHEVFYILYIPFIMGILLLIDKIKPNCFINLIGSITLELYGLQMIFGFQIANTVFHYIKIKFISNILTILILIMMASMISYFFNRKVKLENLLSH